MPKRIHIRNNLNTGSAPIHLGLAATINARAVPSATQNLAAPSAAPKNGHATSGMGGAIHA